MGKSPQDTKCTVDGALIDTGSNIISSVGFFIIGRKSCQREKYKAKMSTRQIRLNGIGLSVGKLEAIMNYIHFGNQEYSEILNIVP